MTEDSTSSYAAAGVDTAAGLPLARLDGPPIVLYTGTMDYAPNAEGLLWLLREVWPRVEAANREAQLVVAGRNPSDAARTLAQHQAGSRALDTGPWARRTRSRVLVETCSSLRSEDVPKPRLDPFCVPCVRRHLHRE